MRKFIVLILIILVILFTSIIVVDERQNVVITDYKGASVVYQAGVHFTLPVLDHVTYVYINERTALLTLSINGPKPDNRPIQLEVLVSYHVISPIDYVAAVNKYGKSGISEKIVQSLKVDIADKLKTESLAEFNRHSLLSVDKSNFITMGINMDRVDLLGMEFILDEKESVKKDVSEVGSLKK